ncbi:hypothetical protein GCM10011380_00840 [Sphingomonas metalli]|uniref:Uncharacterized protein n=1 Tax=Sphingomonas metalli TaxID=1779358 RepID=A0A916WNG7_9SPHN|nr:hypothetical protein [Sphingomonas metalli]GGB15243.1 hypothetical protein GCM10011380_00840 [Sphingomonas metalli]
MTYDPTAFCAEIFSGFEARAAAEAGGTSFPRNDQVAPTTISGSPRNTGFKNTGADSHAIYSTWPTSDYSTEISVGSNADGSYRWFVYISGNGTVQFFRKTPTSQDDAGANFNFNAIRAAGKELRIGYQKKTATTANILFYFDGNAAYTLPVDHIGGQYVAQRVDAAQGPASITYGSINPRLQVTELAFVASNDRRPRGRLAYATITTDPAAPTGWTCALKRRNGAIIKSAQPVIATLISPGLVSFEGTQSVPDSERGQDIVFEFTQTNLPDATSSGILTMPAETASFAVNPNPAVYYYFNTPTANKNSGSWRNAINGGSPDLSQQGKLDRVGSPTAEAYANGARPAMFIHPPRIPNQRMRLMVDNADLTGVQWAASNGALTNMSAIGSSGSTKWIDFNWPWDLEGWLAGTVPTGDPLMFIAPQFNGSTIPANVRLFEINGDGTRVSPGYWDVAHIAEHSRYSKFPLAIRAMDMQNMVSLSSFVFDRVTQQGDIGQPMLTSIPDILDFFDQTGNSGRLHIPLQATENWVRTEARRSAVWARTRVKPVMWTLSNEIWNPGQGAWQTIAATGGLSDQAIQSGLYADPGGSNHDHVMRYWSYRHKQVMVWVMEEFVAEGVASLLLCNIDLQNDNPGNNDPVTKAQAGIGPYIQSISSAPYIGGYKGLNLGPNDTAQLKSLILAMLPDAYTRREQHRQYAVANGWKFFEYEGCFEDVGNTPLWRNFINSQDGIDTLATMIEQHDIRTGGNMTLYTDFRQDTYAIASFIAQTGTAPASRPAPLLKLWHDKIAAA